MSEARRVLLVDDDSAVGTILGALMEQAGFQAELVLSAEAALDAVGARHFDVVITDLRLPAMDGLALLDRVHRDLPELPVIMLTAHGSIPLAVDAMRRGAYDFAVKPFDREELLYTVKRAIARAAQTDAVPPEPRGERQGMIISSPAMREVAARVAKAAKSRATVLVRGESGTGKELVARAIHEQSPRAGQPFVKVHCAALPDTLLESELFGYEKGAFTGAVTSRPGRVELADGGTMFLDEIGDVSPAFQVKLLRLLQDREFERLGGRETKRADIRFVAATHQPLEQMVAEGRFREDLLYRLDVVPIPIPPLRERTDEIPELVRHFGGARVGFDDDAIELLRRQPWPGNVRQLQNFVERVIALSDERQVTAAAVERELQRAPALVRSEASPSGATLDEQRRSAEREALRDALARARNNRTTAARLLGVSRRTLYNKLAEHGLE